MISLKHVYTGGRKHHLAGRTELWVTLSLIIYPRFRDPLCDQGFGQVMNWVDWFCTSADEQVFSGVTRCRDGVIDCCGVWLFFNDLLFLVTSHFGHSLVWSPACLPTGSLLHRCSDYNLSTTMQRPIVKLCGTSSEWWILLCWSVWNSKTTLASVHQLFWGMLGRGDGRLRGIGVSGSGYNDILSLEVLNMVDCVQLKRCSEFLTSVSAPHAVAEALLFKVSLRVCICTCCMCVHICVYVCMFMNTSICIYLYVYLYRTNRSSRKTKRQALTK